MGYKKGQHPNSIKALKPCKTGEVRNPEGGRAHDPMKREWKQCTLKYVRDIINIVVMGQPSDLEKIYSCPENSDDPSENAKRVLAKYVHNAINSGDWPSIERILERVIGKIPDKIEVEVESTVRNLNEDPSVVTDRLKQNLAKLKVLDE